MDIARPDSNGCPAGGAGRVDVVFVCERSDLVTGNLGRHFHSPTHYGIYCRGCADLEFYEIGLREVNGICGLDYRSDISYRGGGSAVVGVGPR
jgi:hypothetical protein